MVDLGTGYGFAEAAVLNEFLFELTDLLVEPVGRRVFATRNTKQILIGTAYTSPYSFVAITEGTLENGSADGLKEMRVSLRWKYGEDTASKVEGSSTVKNGHDQNTKCSL